MNMPITSTRREVLASLCLVSTVPNLSIAKDISTKKLTPVTADKMTPINDDFCSVNGWVISTRTLISGAK